MKLLAFTDVHSRESCLNKIKEKALKHEPDLLVCCGDLSIFTKGLNEGAKFLNKLNIKTLIIPGNHETPEDIKKICSNYRNLIPLHKGEFIYKEYSFFGWGTGGFSYIEEEFERIIKQFKKTYDKTKKLIFITHAPPYKTKLDDLTINGVGHRGCKSTRNFIDEVQPLLVLCGHFHENFRKQDKINKTLIVNPGPDGMMVEL